MLTVLLKQKKYITVPEKWAQNPEIGSKTLVFYSKNRNATAKYDEIKYFFDQNEEVAYEAIVVKKCGK